MPDNSDPSVNFRQWLVLRPMRFDLLLPIAIPSFMLSTFIYGAFIDVTIPNPDLQHRIFGGFLWVAGWLFLEIAERDRGSAYPAIIAMWLAIWFVLYMTCRYFGYRWYVWRHPKN